MTTSLRKQAVSSIKWQVTSSLFQKIITFGVTIILARKLGPENYGLFGLAIITINAFGLFKSFGIENALIQRKKEIDTAASTAFYIIPTLGLFLYAILFFLAPAIGEFLKVTELSKIIRALGIIFVFNCFARVPLSLLERDMKYLYVSTAETIGTICFVITSIISAFLGAQVWSLIFGSIAQNIVTTILIWLFAKWRPKLLFNIEIARESFNFGKFIFLGGVLWFLKMNLDNFFVAKMIGITALGLYAVAFNISNFASDYFGMRLQRVAFPAYSRMQDDPEYLSQTFLKFFKHIFMVTVPLGLGIFIIGNDFLMVAYGEKWLGATNVLRILALAGIFNTLPICNNSLFLAIKRPKLQFWYIFIQVAIFLTFLSPFARAFGISGIAIIVTVGSLVSMVFSFYWIKKLLLLNYRHMFIHIKGSFLASIFMALTLILIKKYLAFLQIVISPFYNFFLLCFISSVAYIYMLNKIEKGSLLEIKKLVINK